MQMFGVGILELLVVMLLTVIVVGPDRMPQVAADLARWIRQGRAYAKHLMGDFNEVVGELQKEANVSQEDWQEISSVIKRNTGDVGKELTRAAKDAEEAGDLALAKANEPVATSTNGSAANGANGSAAKQAEAPAAEDAPEEAPAEEKPWYEPEKTPRASRRRRSSE
jgi:sec-independent protein translocase protein TatB